MSGRTYTLQEVWRQTSALPSDLHKLGRPARVAARGAIERLGAPDRVVLLGSGDSLHASLVSCTAFHRAGVECRVMSGSEFLQDPPRHDTPVRSTVVVGVSASGGNASVIAAVTSARRHGHPTVAVTGAAGGRLASAAEIPLVLAPGPSAPSPGIRTYQAALLSLLHLARAVCRARPSAPGLSTPATTTALLDGLLEPEPIARAQEWTIKKARRAAQEAARLLAPAPVVFIVAGAAEQGTARYVAAKLTETAGVPAVAVEPEDWWHVHRFGHDVRHPVVFWLTPGGHREAVLETARRTAARRRLIAVSEAADDTAGLGAVTVPVADGVPEIARPLVDAAVAGPIAAELACLLGRLPFARQ